MSEQQGQRQGLVRTLVVALVVSAFCSIAVSSISVSLRPLQQANVENDKRLRILAAAGHLPADGDLEAAFADVTVRQVDLSTGELLPAGAEPAQTVLTLSDDEDLAQIRKYDRYSPLYFFGTPERFDVLVLPVHGYGLWSTLYGYLAIDGDLRQVVGLEFYEHKETAGLGGEVDNPKWKALWRGKQLYGRDGSLALQVVKGQVLPGSSMAPYQVDGLAGATLTSRGVSNMLAFWLGENGFAPLLDRLRAQKLTDDTRTGGDDG